MNAVSRVKSICKEKKIAIARLESDLGFGNGYIRNLKKGTFPDDRLNMIADYLGVSYDYLSKGIDTNAVYIETSNAVLEGIKKDPTSISADEVLAEELINRLCLLTDEELAKVDAFVQGLLASR